MTRTLLALGFALTMAAGTVPAYAGTWAPGHLYAGSGNEQDQGKGQGQDQGKDQGQDQGKGQGQQDQGKGQGQQEDKGGKLIAGSGNEQDQGKGQGQDQGKNQGQGQDQGKDQGQQDQGKGQGKDILTSLVYLDAAAASDVEMLRPRAHTTACFARNAIGRTFRAMTRGNLGRRGLNMLQRRAINACRFGSVFFLRGTCRALGCRVMR